MKTGQSKSRLLYIYGLLILPLLIAVACQSAPDAKVLVVATQETAIVPTRTAPVVSTEEIVTGTATSIPTVTSIKVTETLAPSPIPTLSPAEKMATASELYDTNANCRLPCWWGIVPGETEWAMAKPFLSTIATEITTGTESESEPLFVVEVTVPVPEDLSEINLLGQTFIVRDGVIVKIKPEGPWGTRKVATVSEILSTYGPPTEVWMKTWGYTFEDNYYPFHIALFYPEKGFLVRYFDDADLTNDHLTGCPQEDSATFILWSPEREVTFESTLGRQHGVQYYKPLQEATEMDVEAFYQTYLDPDTETCITTPAELWMQ